ncbi:MAG TPA: hypothetical protein VM075_01490 [Anaerolineae bacterium]|nr:hypothetical protein [Anaerolineae bacterium]
MLRGDSLNPLAAAVIGICGTILAATYTAHASHVAAQGGWPPPVELSSQSGDGTSRGPDLAIAQSGDLHVIWMEPEAGGVTFTVYHASSHNQGSNWSYSVPLAPAGNDREQGAMDVDQYGTAHAVWIEHPGAFELRYALLSEDVWQGPTIITHSNYLTREILSPDVVTTQDFVHAVWSETNRGPAGSSRLDVFYSRSEAGGLWSPATTTVETHDSSDGPRVATDQAGDLHVVWEESPTTTPHSIYYISGTVSAEETIWSVPVTVSEGLTQTATTPDIAVGSDYWVHVVFGVDVENQQYVQDIYYARFPVNDPGLVSATLIPGSRVTVSQQLPTFASPAVALFGDHQVHVAWNGWKAGDNWDSDRIYYAVSENGGGSWSEPVAVSPKDSRPDGFPSLAADGQFVHVVWQEKDPPTDQDIFYTRRFPIRITFPLALKAF